MTVSTTTSSVSYTGDGTTTVFPVTFPFQANSDLVVTETLNGVTTTKAITTHYTVTGAGTASGTVTMLTAPATGVTLTITRSVPITQETSFRTQGTFSPRIHEDAFDKLTMAAQEMDRRVDATEAKNTSQDAAITAGDTAVRTELATTAAQLRAEFDTAPGSTIDTRTVQATGTGGATKAMNAWMADVERLDEEWFVDGVAGSDANDGRTEATPLQTIAALVAKPIRRGATLFIKRGSYFREQLNLLTPERIRVEAYGNGPRPVFDCSDTVSTGAWSKTGGLTNVYQVSWAHSLGTVKTKHSVWENGVRLTRATSQANCDATPGSFYAATPTASPNIIYVHATGSGDPATNGKTYEFAKRERGVLAYAVVGIHTRRNGSDDGSLYATYAKDCVAEDGTVHNAWNEGLFEDVIAWKCEGYSGAGSSTMFISHDDVNNQGVIYRRCKAIGQPFLTGSSPVGFYYHTTGAVKYKKVLFEDCIAVGLATGFGGGNTERATYVRCKTFRCTQGLTAAPDYLYVLGCVFVDGTVTPATAVMNQAISTAAPATIRGCTIVARKCQGALVWMSGAVDIRQCTFQYYDATGSPHIAARVDSPGTLKFRNNVIGGGSAAWQVHAGSALVDLEDNVYYQATIDFIVGGTTYADMAAYKAVYTTFDLNSLQTDPTFIGQVRNGDVRVGNSSPAWTLKAGSAYQEGDFDETLAGLVETAQANF